MSDFLAASSLQTQNKRNLLFQVQTDAAPTKTDAPTKMNFFAYVISCKQIKILGQDIVYYT